MRLQVTTSKQTHRVAAHAPNPTHLTYLRVNTARTQRIRCYSTASDRIKEEKDGSSGSVWGSALLVSGTTIGAGILALPAVTQEAGFVPAAVTLTAVCGFSIITGLLVAETSMCLSQKQGSGSVSMVTMANETLGPGAAVATSAAYIFLHYALLVAYISKAGETVSDVTGLPLVPAAAAFTVAFGLLCYLSSQRLLDKLNGGLVGLVVACFLGLLLAAGPNVDGSSLLHNGHWSAVPATLPVVALAFVYHNVVPVLVNALAGDKGKIRTAICAGVAIPWLMFVSWEAAILGSLGSLKAEPTVLGAAVQQQQGVITEGQLQQDSPAASSGTMRSSSSSSSSPQQLGMQLQEAPQLEAAVASSSGESMVSHPVASSSSSIQPSDPLAALSAANAVVAPLIQGFSFLAIATSYIGFILGLTDFICDALKLPNRQAPVPYLLTLLPPFGIAVTNPNIFLQALDTAGTYGVLTLFGILPPAMAWRLRYGAQHTTRDFETGREIELIPGGQVMLLAVAGAASAVVAYEVLGLLKHA